MISISNVGSWGSTLDPIILVNPGVWSVCLKKKEIKKQKPWLQFKDRKEKIYEGEIKKDLTTNLTDKTAYPYKRQVVKGIIVHWLQKDFDPEKCADMFLQELPCELDKKAK